MNDRCVFILSEFKDLNSGSLAHNLSDVIITESSAKQAGLPFPTGSGSPDAYTQLFVEQISCLFLHTQQLFRIVHAHQIQIGLRNSFGREELAEEFHAFAAGLA